LIVIFFKDSLKRLFPEFLEIFLKKLGVAIKTLPKMASKFSFSSLRCKLCYLIVLPHCVAEASKKLPSKTEVFSVTFYRRLV